MEYMIYSYQVGYIFIALGTPAMDYEPATVSSLP